MPTTPSVDTTLAPIDALRIDALWKPSFPSAELVSAAAALFTAMPTGWASAGRVETGAPLDEWGRVRTNPGGGRRYAMPEGPRSRLVIGPGVVQVTATNPVRAERRHERSNSGAALLAGDQLRASDLLLEDRLTESDETLEALATLAAAGCGDWPAVERQGDWSDHLAGRIERRDQEDTPGPARITGWSRKSRARMVRTLIALDYAPMFTTGEAPAMLTLTYPGDWLAVAPDAATCAGHVKALGKRFRRAWGRPLVATWKREFQRRGAPHYHLLMVPPTTTTNGEDFRIWISRVWAEIVGAASCGEAEPALDERGRIVCCERHRHVAGGTGVDYREGLRHQDPRRLAVYFSKHGSFGAKDYQNDAPAEWVEAGSVGRFWGYWGLELGTAVVEVSPVEADAAARVLRRWQAANGFRVQREVRRRRVDPATGEIRHSRGCVLRHEQRTLTDESARNLCDGYCWRRKSGVWVGSRMRGRLGFVAVNDGPAFAGRLAGYLDQVRERAQAVELAALGCGEDRPERAGAAATYSAAAARWRVLDAELAATRAAFG